MGKTAIKWMLGVAVGAFFIWLAAGEWPLDDLACDALRSDGTSIVCVGRGWSVQPLWLLAAFVVLSLVHFMRVLRWKPLLEPLAHHDFWTLNRVCAVSFMILFILPFRLGELARPYLIAAEGKVRKSAVFGTIAVERVMDGLMMALLLFIVLMFLPADHQSTAYYSLKAGSLIALAVFVAALGILVLAHFSRRLALRMVDAVVGPVSKRFAERVGGMVNRFIDGLQALPSPRSVFRSVLWTAGYWSINGLVYWFLARAFGLEHQVTLPVAYAMMAAVAVGMMVPNPPGMWGRSGTFYCCRSTSWALPARWQVPWPSPSRSGA